MHALMLAVLLLVGSNVLVMEHLALDAPQGWTVESHPGLDFTTFSLQPPEGSASRISIYLGNHPSAMAPRSATRSEPFSLGQKQVRWSVWQERTNGVTHYRAELLVKKPFGIEPGGSDSLHIFVSAPSAEDLASVQAIASAVRPVQAR